MGPKIVVRKIPLVTRLKDISPDAAFGPLDNLRLDLLEDKRKLKPGLPLVPIRRPRPAPAARPPRGDAHSAEQQRPAARASGEQEEPAPALVVPSSAAPAYAAEPDDAALIAALGADSPPRPDPAESERVSGAEEPHAAAGGGAARPAGPPAETPRAAAAEEARPPRAAGSPRAAPPDAAEPEEEEDDMYAGLSPEEREKKEREHYRWRFRILKKQYPDVEIPNADQYRYSDIDAIKSQYDDTLRDLELDDNVETYRNYLIVSWLAIEFASTQWLGIDMTGFTRYQGMMMSKYNRLLIELGEKKRGAWGADLPVEVRLIGLVLFQAGVFFLIKVAAEKFGANVGDLIAIFVGQRAGAAGDDDGAEAADGSSFLGAMMSGVAAAQKSGMFSGGGGGRGGGFAAGRPAAGAGAPFAGPNGGAPGGRRPMRGPSQTAADIRSQRRSHKGRAPGPGSDDSE